MVLPSRLGVKNAVSCLAASFYPKNPQFLENWIPMIGATGIRPSKRLISKASILANFLSGPTFGPIPRRFSWGKKTSRSSAGLSPFERRQHRADGLRSNVPVYPRLIVMQK
jgi:hypothetical protein